MNKHHGAEPKHDTGRMTAEDRALQALIGAPQVLPHGEECSCPSSERILVDPHAIEGQSDPRSVLRKIWGYNDFRGVQREIIDHVLEKKDTLGLMPTGGGKSITFQVPALMLPGTCLVITPLIALMKDQVEHLREKGIKATAIHSGLTREEINRELDNVILGHYKFLYLSPERIHTELFRLKLAYMNVSFITVDEAHCISQWGYDFRPSYLQVREVRRLLPEVAVLALTATATTTVIKDIQQQLDFRRSKVFRMSFDRPNLTYRVAHSDNKVEDLIDLLQTTTGTAIVYTRSRGGTRETALALQRAGISALYYHAGLPTADKDARQEAWQSGHARVMVATNAFGMGIDKSDVRIVVHLDPPDSIEAYFQEAGRAGRDGKAAQAVLLYNERDTRLLLQRVRQTFPDKDMIRNIYDDVACFLQIGMGEGEGRVCEFDLEDFCKNFHYFPLTVVNAFTILERAGHLIYADKHDTRSRIMMIVRKEDLYHLRYGQDKGDRVLTALLREYTGIFADYVFIEETALARRCDLCEDEIYQTLLYFNRMRLLHYIPRKSVATVTYLSRRVESTRLGLGADVYETRLQQYSQRIEGVVRYCVDTDVCRNVQLLSYFDEQQTVPCGRCDVCQPEHAGLLSCADLECRLRHVLADGQPHPASDFHIPLADAEKARRLLESWMNDGVVVSDGMAFRQIR